MAYVLTDRTRDTTTTTGTGTITVSGTAPTTYRTFSVVCAVGDVFPYFIQHQTADEWEVGIATYTAANQFTRDTILASSSFGSPDAAPTPVNFSAGTKDVVLDVSAAVYQSDQSENVYPWMTLGGF